VAAVLGLIRDLGDLKQRDLSNQNLGDLKKGPKGVLSPAPQKKMGQGRPRLRWIDSMSEVLKFNIWRRKKTQRKFWKTWVEANTQIEY
jgi:hypothetical protein